MTEVKIENNDDIKPTIGNDKAAKIVKQVEVCFLVL